MIQIQNISLSFGKQTIFDHISFVLQPNQRVGLVGANGSGKSTLLKVITKSQLLDSGTVSIVNNYKVAYMPQDVVLQSQKSVYEEAFSSFTQLIAVLATIEKLEKIMTENPTAEDISAYATAQEQLQLLDLDDARAQTGAVLQGLGFSQERQQESVTSLSVGWKMRLVLAKLLLQKADFYLFDEPTNHLDIAAKDWFLDFLDRSSFGFLLVCHERYFLDRSCTHILELERGKATMYRGNYSAYVEQKEHSMAALEAAYNQQQREIAAKKATIERFRASASKAKMAQSMMKELDALELIPQPVSPLRKWRINFGATQRAGKVVLKVDDCSFSFGTKSIFNHISFEIERGEKVALIAPNGTGKTTLFNVIAGIYKRQTGSIELGYNVVSALFAQDQDTVLNPRSTILEHLERNCPGKTHAEIRGFLGAFLFSNDDVHKKLGVLSGGEKNRVSMVTVLLQGANFLLLDEPTNHLDMQSKEVLLQALQQYDGTLFFVSHDHDFINNLATRILELTHDGIISYPGTYAEYQLYKQERAALASGKSSGKNSAVRMDSTGSPRTGQPDSDKTSDNAPVNQFEIKKQLKKLENSIEKTEELIATTEESFAQLSYGSPEFANQQTKLKTLKKDLERQWEELGELHGKLEK